MGKFKMGSDPLFNLEQEQEIKKQDSRRDPELDKYTRMTFIIRKDLLNKFRDYAYTERIEQKEAINTILEEYLGNKTDLLEAPKKTKQKRPSKKAR